MEQDRHIELHEKTNPHFDLPMTRENATHLCVPLTRSDSSAGQEDKRGMEQWMV